MLYEPDATGLPSAENATKVTQSEWFSGVALRAPLLSMLKIL
jgi:hypothetical protein